MYLVFYYFFKERVKEELTEPGTRKHKKSQKAPGQNLTTKQPLGTGAGLCGTSRA